MKIYGIRCLKCGDTIYSRARHDMRFCSCGAVAIDGGQDYQKISAQNPNDFESVKIELDIHSIDLYRDWASGADEYGIIYPTGAEGWGRKL